ncbi:microfibril-associated glycoprotein 4-like [Mytilus trossulus]|uniref:microfibril-associated glycoprotein 4-like n=1 Tax=Mytilus trossulus TaxID=6551 RepID=UPI003005909A
MICKTHFPIAACMFLSLCAGTRTVKSQNFKIHLNTQLKENGTHFMKKTELTLYSCATVCANEEDCCSASFKTESRQCDLFSSCDTTEDQLLEIAGVHTIQKTPLSASLADCSFLPPDSSSGVYTIKTKTGMNIDVFCEMGIDNGGWTLIQRRFDGSTGFDRVWHGYKTGFGKVDGEHWLGNDHIYAITQQRSYKVRFDLEDFRGQTAYAIYTSFSINNEETNYTLSINGFSGNAGDSITSTAAADNNGMMFSTRDRDNDASAIDCVNVKGGAWWFKDCSRANINGYYGENAIRPSSLSVHWKSWLDETPLKITIMMIKPN